MIYLKMIYIYIYGHYIPIRMVSALRSLTQLGHFLKVMLINFATEQKLVILADEVYQENVYKEVRTRRARARARQEPVS